MRLHLIAAVVGAGLFAAACEAELPTAPTATPACNCDAIPRAGALCADPNEGGVQPWENWQARACILGPEPGPLGIDFKTVKTWTRADPRGSSPHQVELNVTWQPGDAWGHCRFAAYGGMTIPSPTTEGYGTCQTYGNGTPSGDDVTVTLRDATGAIQTFAVE